MNQFEDPAQLDHTNLLATYIKKYEINSYFSNDLSAYMKLIHFKRNDYICKADEPITALYFFIHGKAKVYTPLSNGKSLLLCFYKPLMVIGDAEILVSNAASTNLQVIEDSLCIAIDFAVLRTHALKDAVFLYHMTESLSTKLLRLSKYSSINLLYPLENRLASYLLAVLPSQSIDEKDTINLTEIAELLGTSYRHLHRTLNKLTEAGCIKKKTHSYEIMNHDLLQTIAADLYE